MSPEALIDLMHDGLLRIQRDVARLSEAVQEHESSGYYAFMTGRAELTDHAIAVRAKIELIVSAITPLALPHIAASAATDREHGHVAH